MRARVAGSANDNLRCNVVAAAQVIARLLVLQPNRSIRSGVQNLYRISGRIALRRKYVRTLLFGGFYSKSNDRMNYKVV